MATPILLSGCSTPGLEWEVPYLADGLGIGANPNVLTIARPAQGASQSNNRHISDAIVQALQRLQNSVIAPEDVLNHGLPENAQWRSDTAIVEPAVIVAHNQQFPHLSLPTNRLWGVQYVGRFRVSEQSIRFEISSQLFEKGFGTTSFRQIESRAYSGQFFCARLKTVIQDELSKLSPKKKTP